MIGELEQCACGIIFEVNPGVNIEMVGDYRQHFISGAHRRGMNIHICAACFADLCGQCEKERSVPHSDKWHCDCECNPVVVEKTMDRDHEAIQFSFIWSLWLFRGGLPERTVLPMKGGEKP